MLDVFLIFILNNLARPFSIFTPILLCSSIKLSKPFRVRITSVVSVLAFTVADLGKVSIIEKLFPNPRLVWGLSAAAVAVILILIITSPLNRNGLKSISAQSEFSWDDDFFVQADFIDREIDRVQSGALLTHYFSSGEDPSESDLLDSVLSPDIDRIKDKVVDLARTIYGI